MEQKEAKVLRGGGRSEMRLEVDRGVNILHKGNLTERRKQARVGGAD